MDTLECPEINPCTYGQQIYNKESKTYNGEKIVSSIGDSGKIGQLLCKRIKLGYLLIPHTK